MNLQPGVGQTGSGFSLHHPAPPTAGVALMSGSEVGPVTLSQGFQQCLQADVAPDAPAVGIAGSAPGLWPFTSTFPTALGSGQQMAMVVEGEVCQTSLPLTMVSPAVRQMGLLGQPVQSSSAAAAAGALDDRTTVSCTAGCAQTPETIAIVVSMGLPTVAVRDTQLVTVDALAPPAPSALQHNVVPVQLVVVNPGGQPADITGVTPPVALPTTGTAKPVNHNTELLAALHSRMGQLERQVAEFCCIEQQVRTALVLTAQQTTAPLPLDPTPAEAFQWPGWCYFPN